MRERETYIKEKLTQYENIKSELSIKENNFLKRSKDLEVNEYKLMSNLTEY